MGKPADKAYGIQRRLLDSRRNVEFACMPELANRTGAVWPADRVGWQNGASLSPAMQVDRAARDIFYSGFLACEAGQRGSKNVFDSNAIVLSGQNL